MRPPHARWLGPLLALLLAPRATAGTITVSATFKFLGPDGIVAPIAGAYCELRDYDPISDDILGRSVTDTSGTVTFTYDSGLDDGWLGGRVDPYVRCYSRLMVESGGQAVEKAAVVKKRRLDVTSVFTDLACYEINTPTWDNNHEDRTAAITDETDDRHAFYIMAAIALANSRQPKPGGTLLDAAPIALQGDTAAGRTLLVFPAVLGTGFQSRFGDILIEDKYKSDFDTIIHEYGHHEMWDAYGGTTFGEYSRLQRDHSFSGVLEDGTFSADAAWTAFAEAWADFSAVITKGYPRYRSQDVEADDQTRSPRCEGTICRIFWDVWDTSADQVVDLSGNPVARPRRAGVVLDDDPFGFIARPPFSGFPGRNQLKSILRHDKPKSLADFRAAFARRYASSSLTRRAFDAILYRHGIRDGITEHAPQCQLTVEGSRLKDVYTGGLRLSATVSDADITPSTPEDGRLMHVTFYWSAYAERGDMLGGTGPDDWQTLCVDTDGTDGWHCEWPATAPDRPAPVVPVVITAVASDFFEHSAFGFTKATLTAAQHGPFRLEAGATGGGGTDDRPPDESGPLTSEGSFYTGISVANIRYDRGYLLLANGYQGLKIYPAAASASVPVSTYKPAGAVFTDACDDADAFTRRDPSGQTRRYAALAFGSKGLRIVDITDPGRPLEVGALTTVPDRSPAGPTGLHARLVAVQGSYAYVVSGGLSMIDIEDPRAPREVSFWAPAKSGSCREIRGLRVQGSVAYLACIGSGFSMLDLDQARSQRVYLPHIARRDPSLVLPETMLLGGYKPEGTVVALDLIRRPEEGRTWAVILEVNRGRGATHRAHVIDVTSPQNPARVAQIELPALPFRVRVAGDAAYIGHSKGLTILDINRPGAPILVGEYRRPTLYTADAIEVAGLRVFVSTGESVHVLKVRH